MSIWGKHAARYEGTEQRRHRLLALDGGGLRGILALEILERMEGLLADVTGAGADFRLCHFFDYVAGTSSGATMATGIARGMRVRELLDFYEQLGPRVFTQRSVLNPKWWTDGRYSSEPMKREFQAMFGTRTTLRPDDLECLLLVVTLNRTTDSPWPISSNPQARYNDCALPDCNLKIPLWQLARASAAAPFYFPPEVIHWDPDDPSKTFVFVDGGITPYNSPSFLLYRMATEPAFNLGWVTGEDRLLLVSVGTGAGPTLDMDVVNPNKGTFDDAKGLAAFIDGMMFSALVAQDTNCRSVGRCVHGAPLDTEVGDMIPRDDHGEPIPLSQDCDRRFLYVRYNADLSRPGLDAMGFTDIEPTNIQKFDSTEFLADLHRIGRKVAEDVHLEHFGSFV